MPWVSEVAAYSLLSIQSWVTAKPLWKPCHLSDPLLQKQDYDQMEIVSFAELVFHIQRNWELTPFHHS